MTKQQEDLAYAVMAWLNEHRPRETIAMFNTPYGVLQLQWRGASRWDATYRTPEPLPEGIEVPQ